MYIEQRKFVYTPPPQDLVRPRSHQTMTTRGEYQGSPPANKKLMYTDLPWKGTGTLKIGKHTAAIAHFQIVIGVLLV